MNRITPIFLVIFFCIGLTCAFSATPAHESPPLSPMDNTPSEITIIPQPIANEPIVSFRFVFHTGSADDPAGQNGLAYLTARMLAKGGTQKNHYRDILKKMFPIASSYDVQVDREYTTFYGSTHQDNVALFYIFFKEALLEPAFLEEDLNRLKSAAIDEIKSILRYNNDEELGKALFKSFAYRGSRYENHIGGTVSALEKLTVADIKGFYKTHFCRNRLIIGISGNYPAMLCHTIGQDFSQLPKIPYHREAIKPEPITGLQVLLVEKPGDSTGIHMGFPIPLLRKDADFFALFLANSWFGEHRTPLAHLYRVIREQRGFNYGDYSYIEDFPNNSQKQFPPPNTYKNPQLFEIWIRPVENQNRFFVLKAVLRELQAWVEKGINQEDFQLLKTMLGRYYAHAAPTSDVRLGYKIDDVIHGLGESYLDHFKKNINALTLEQVNQTIKKYLQADNLKIVMVTSNAAALKTAMIANAPSPITYHSPKPEAILQEDKQIESFPLKIQPQNITIIKVDHVFQ